MRIGQWLTVTGGMVFLILCQEGPGRVQVGAQGVQRSDSEHGRYLVHQVAMCVQCHSPRDAQGRLIGRQHLLGGIIPVSAPYPQMEWSIRSPSLRGLAGWTDDEIIALLTTGRRQDGTVPRPPMPRFGMTIGDAQAVVAYLRAADSP